MYYSWAQHTEPFSLRLPRWPRQGQFYMTLSGLNPISWKMWCRSLLPPQNTIEVIVVLLEVILDLPFSFLSGSSLCKSISLLSCQLEACLSLKGSMSGLQLCEVTFSLVAFVPASLLTLLEVWHLMLRHLIAPERFLDRALWAWGRYSWVGHSGSSWEYERMFMSSLVLTKVSKKKGILPVGMTLDSLVWDVEVCSSFSRPTLCKSCRWSILIRS